MDNFVVSARKYRPVTFKSVVGQASITQTLKNSIKNNHLGHAYLFCGPRGVGKTTCARIFAKTINCKSPTTDFEACNECESCKAFNEGRSYNIHELDAASNNSVEDIRTLIEQVRIPPQIGKYSVYIIDEVHMLSQQAFNAFLKTLEEPPAHALFVMATTEKHKILPTILSRCQIFDFNRIKVEDAVEHLAYVAESEGINADRDALNIIAQKADGAMRDALSFFDQIVSFSGKDISYQDAIDNLNVLDYEYYFRLTDAFRENKIAESLLVLDEILDKGFDGHHFITGLSSHVRDLLVCKNKNTVELLEVGDTIKKRYLQQAQNSDLAFLSKALDISNSADLTYRDSKNKRLQIELALIKCCNITNRKTSETDSNSGQNSGLSQDSPATYKKTEKAGQKPEKKRKPVSIQNKINTSGVSLNKKKQTEPKKTESEQKSKEESKQKKPDDALELNKKNIETAWNRFLEKVKDKRRLYNVLKENLPEAQSENTMVLFVPTEQFKNYMGKMQAGIISILKRELKNPGLKLKIEVSEQKSGDDKKKLYTNKDKYRFLKQKNENIDLLKDSFNLDF